MGLAIDGLKGWRMFQRTRNYQKMGVFPSTGTESLPLQTLSQMHAENNLIDFLFHLSLPFFFHRVPRTEHEGEGKLNDCCLFIFLFTDITKTL